MSRPTRFQLFSVLLGCGLLAGGQAMLFEPEPGTALVEGTLGAWGGWLLSLFSETFARGVALGLGLMLLGGWLVARVIGLNAPEPALERRTAAGLAPFSKRKGIPAGTALALCLSLASAVAFTRPEPGTTSVWLWLGALLAGLLLAWQLDRRRGSTPGLPFSGWEWWFVIVLMALNGWWVARDLTDWRWSGTPDEAYFFITAKNIVEGRFPRFPLSQDGVFGKNPLPSSYYQAAFMKVFGVDVFGWRLSSVAALVMALPFMYLLGREIWSRRAGVLAAVLFGSAQVAVGFSHLGYNNNHVYPVMVGCLGILAWSIRSRSLAGHYLAGVIAGLGFYTIYSARITPFLALLLVWSCGQLSFKRARAELAALFLGILSAGLPLLAEPGALVGRMLQHTAYAGAAPSGAGAGWGVSAVLAGLEPMMKIGRDWLVSMAYAQWSKCGWNFGWSPVADPVTGAAAMLGLCIGARALRSRSRARFILPAYAVSAFGVGGLSPYPCPPLTRLMTLVPFTVLLAAMGLDQLWRWAAESTRWRAATVLACVGLVASAVAWNLMALHRSIYETHYGYGTGTTSELIRLIQPLPPSGRVIYIQNAENDMYDVNLVLHEYGLGIRTSCFRPFGPPVLTALQQISPPFTVVYDLKREEEIERVEALLRQRFPELRWSDSAPGKRWNLRYASQPAELTPTR